MLTSTVSMFALFAAAMLKTASGQQNTSLPPPATNPPTMSPAINPAVTSTTRQPDTSKIRLAGNTSPSAGRLEVFLDGRWGTVCNDNSFTTTEANVACKQLQGFGQSRLYGTSTLYVNNSSALQNLPIAMGNVDCLSSSGSLQNCSFTSNPGTCAHSDDVGLECSNCSLYLCSDGKCVNAVTCNGKKECNDGSDEDNIVCAIASGLSSAIKIAIGIAITILVLIIVIPIFICVCVCMCTGACIAKAGSSGPRSSKVVATSYNPAPETLKPFI